MATDVSKLIADLTKAIASYQAERLPSVQWLHTISGLAELIRCWAIEERENPRVRQTKSKTTSKRKFSPTSDQMLSLGGTDGRGGTDK